MQKKKKSDIIIDRALINYYHTSKQIEFSTNHQRRRSHTHASAPSAKKCYSTYIISQTQQQKNILPTKKMKLKTHSP